MLTILTFDLSSQFQSAANRCCAYALSGDALVEMQKEIFLLSSAPVEGLLQAKHQLSQAAQEAGKYMF